MIRTPDLLSFLEGLAVPRATRGGAGPFDEGRTVAVTGARARADGSEGRGRGALGGFGPESAERAPYTALARRPVTVASATGAGAPATGTGAPAARASRAGDGAPKGGDRP
ncbi:hypothetical protein RGF97_01265 [Streptomyces roseicoloratus]|uniref:Uncharacterized protein n=1 Tax=Streptomyces roseicoloratus TaxID=2508722 RepID=A0ABY9RPD8_9ACTN|nr:hypothetical protein [Streptomyces roseicoloratus]WMX43772.1 hypothetical protein RGF97_01265 [Streptomyces roseicoloratus]